MQDDYWLDLGVMFPHENGDGINLILQGYPLPDKSGQVKLVMRAYDPDQQVEDEANEQTTAKGKARSS